MGYLTHGVYPILRDMAELTSDHSPQKRRINAYPMRRVTREDSSHVPSYENHQSKAMKLGLWVSIYRFTNWGFEKF